VSLQVVALPRANGRILRQIDQKIEKSGSSPGFFVAAAISENIEHGLWRI
jgi:hypothetical protein